MALVADADIKCQVRSFFLKVIGSNFNEYNIALERIFILVTCVIK